MVLLFLFNPQTHIQHIVQWIFPHYLFNTEGIIARFFKIELPANRGKRNTVFVNIIHTASKPAFIICGKPKIVSSGLCSIRTRLLGTEIDVNIVEVVFVVMTENEKKLVGRRSVFNSESKRWFITTLPRMTGYGNRFFIEINGSAGNKIQGARRKGQEESFNLLHLTKIIFKVQEYKVQGTSNLIYNIFLLNNVVKLQGKKDFTISRPCFLYLEPCAFTIHSALVPSLSPVHLSSSPRLFE